MSAISSTNTVSYCEKLEIITMATEPCQHYIVHMQDDYIMSRKNRKQVSKFEKLVNCMS